MAETEQYIETRLIVQNLYKTMFLMDKLVNKTLDNAGLITFSQFRILIIILRNPQFSQKDVADALHLTKAAISRHVEQLRKLLLLDTKVKHDNRREQEIILTEKGKKIMTQALTLLDATFKKVFNEMDPKEQSQLLTSFGKIIKKMQNENSIECEQQKTNKQNAINKNK